MSGTSEVSAGLSRIAQHLDAVMINSPVGHAYGWYVPGIKPGALLQEAADLAFEYVPVQPQLLTTAMREAYKKLPDMRVSLEEIALARSTIGRLRVAVDTIDAAGGVERVTSAGGLDAIDGAIETWQALSANELRDRVLLLHRFRDNGPGRFELRFGGQAGEIWAARVVAQAQSISGQAAADRISSPSLLKLPELSAAVAHLADTTRGGGSVKSGLSTVGAAFDSLRSTDETVSHGARQSSLASPALRQSIVSLGSHVAAQNAPADNLAAGPQAFDRLAASTALLVDVIPTISGTELMFLFEHYRPLLRTGLVELEELRPTAAMMNDGLADQIDEISAIYRSVTHFSSASYLGNALPRLEAAKAKFVAISADPSALGLAEGEVAKVVRLLNTSGSGGLGKGVPASQLAELQRATTHPRVVGSLVLERMLADHLVTAETVGVPSTADEVLQLLDEVVVLGKALEGTRGKTDAARRLNRPEIRPIAEQMVLRANAAVKLHLPVSELTTAQVGRVARDVLKEAISESPHGRSVDFAKELTDTAELLSRDIRKMQAMTSGANLRSVSPRVRSVAASEAEGAWYIKMLSGAAVSTNVGELPVEERLLARAEELDRVAGALSVHRSLVQGDPNNRMLAALRNSVVNTIKDLSNSWELPDDTAATLQDLRDYFVARNAFDGPSVNGLRQVASEVRSWALFADGQLPKTNSDRAVVAARRAQDAAATLDLLLNNIRSQQHRPQDIVGEYRNLEGRVRGLIEISRDRLLGGAADQLEASLAAVSADFARSSTGPGGTTTDWVPNLGTLDQLRGDLEKAEIFLKAEASSGLGAQTAGVAASSGRALADGLDQASA